MNRDITLTTDLCANVMDAHPSRERLLAIEHLIRQYGKPEEYTVEKGVIALETLASAVLELRDELIAAKEAQ